MHNVPDATTDDLMPSPSPIPVEGRGATTLVMLHGWPDGPALWDAQVAAFGAHFRCVRFALPGFVPGDGMATASKWRPPSLQQVVDRLGEVIDQASPDRPVVLLLHDWGSLFGQQYAALHPQRVAAVVAVDVGDIGSRDWLLSLDWKAKAMLVGYQGWLAIAWWLGGALGDRMTRFMARQLRAPGAAADIHAGMNYPYFVQWTGASGGYRKVRRFDPLALGIPMFYLYGTRKPFNFHSPAWAEALAARSGNRVLAMRTGHWLMTQAPAAFNEAVLGWLLATVPAGDNAGHADPRSADPER